jgi:glycosyltransferase involved in cell wall biosynthesis
MLRVAILHNAYRQPGGEERLVGDLTALLRARGHQVEVIERSSAHLDDAGGRLRAGAAMLRGGADPGAIERALAGADVLHAHNIHPLFGPRALQAARRAGARVVLQVHNYRLFCAIGIAYRDGAPCPRCRGRATFPGARLRCRGGVAESAAYAAALSLHQPSVLESVDSFIAPSRATADEVVERAGVRADRIDVIPHFVPDSTFSEESAADRGAHALYAGRLAEEKGVDTAIAATAKAGVPLVIAGAGPDEERLRRIAADSREVRFLGHVDAAELDRLRRGAALALVPSRWHEPHPYAVAEAMAAGLPVIASDVGGLPELAGAGSVLPPTNIDAWAEAIAALWADPDLRRRRGQEALARARERFSEDLFYERLLNAYGPSD